MQTTQGQPLQYTLPVVQPNMAPPLRPNVKEGYKSHTVRQLAIAQLVLGCLAFSFQIWDTLNQSELSGIGAGIWSGVFFIFTGGVGLVSVRQKTVCSIVSYMALSILSSLLAISLLVITSINLSYYNYCTGYHDWLSYCRYIDSYTISCTMFLMSMLVLISVAEGLMAVLAASFACHGCCCSTPTQSVFPYTTPVQYVQGPNGQLMMVSGQQPHMLNSMAGPQIFIAGSAGNYQAQMNVSMPFPTQGYTVPTMPDQQPMPQPESVPPPPYQTVVEQATGNQQPQVHQSAADGKTNTAYMDN